MRWVVSALVVVAAVMITAFWWSGMYDVAATRQEPASVRRFLATTRDRSIAAHSVNVSARATDEPAMVITGAPEYERMCSPCHGAPGRDRSAVGKGLNPSPPDLSDARFQRRYSDNELFWIVQHGIRRTGMPAFGDTHDDTTLWNVIAVVRRLPTLRADDYAALARVEAAPEHHANAESAEPSGG